MSPAMSGSPMEGGRRRVIRVVIRAEKVTWEHGKKLPLKYLSTLRVGRPWTLNIQGNEAIVTNIGQLNCVSQHLKPGQ